MTLVLEQASTAAAAELQAAPSGPAGMRVELWGTRGSISSAGPETVRYGGNTACVEVTGRDGTELILDAGAGIRRLGERYRTPRRLDVLLTHLHLDHIQGLGFFLPLFTPDFEVHLWGPPSPTSDLRARIGRYLSPPLFPVRLRDLTARIEFHEASVEPFSIGGLTVSAQPVSHPGPTVGYRISDGRASLAYIPDHEPALAPDSAQHFPARGSGLGLAEGVDLLIHDTQYTDAEYAAHAGWGHSRMSDAIGLTAQAGARRLVTFHHDPGHDDELLDRMLAEARATAPRSLEVLPGREGSVFSL